MAPRKDRREARARASRHARRSSRIERVAYPFDAAFGFDQQRVEPALLITAAAREIEARSRRQPAALGRADAFRGPAARSAGARTYFNEYERPPVARDQIDLAEAAAPIAFDDLQALSMQEPRGARLGVASELIQWRTPIGTGRPSAYCAGVSSRMK